MRWGYLEPALGFGLAWETQDGRQRTKASKPTRRWCGFRKKLLILPRKVQAKK